MLIAIFGGTLEILRDMSARKSCQVDKPLKGTFSVLFAGCCLLNVDFVISGFRKWNGPRLVYFKTARRRGECRLHPGISAL